MLVEDCLAIFGDVRMSTIRGCNSLIFDLDEPRGLPHGLGQEMSSVARTLGSWVPVSLKAWASVLCTFIL
jgi:hypothetical protein